MRALSAIFTFFTLPVSPAVTLATIAGVALCGAIVATVRRPRAPVDPNRLDIISVNPLRLAASTRRPAAERQMDLCEAFELLDA